VISFGTDIGANIWLAGVGISDVPSFGEAAFDDTARYQRYWQQVATRQSLSELMNASEAERYQAWLLGKRMQAHCTNAAQYVDQSPANLLGQLTPDQRLQFGNGEMVFALRGKAVEKVVRRLIGDDPALSPFVTLGKLNRGPDILWNGGEALWWDITTSAEWAKKLDKPASLGYRGIGAPLYTDY
jgi:hypothetical protein